MSVVLLKRFGARTHHDETRATLARTTRSLPQAEIVVMAAKHA